MKKNLIHNIFFSLFLLTPVCSCSGAESSSYPENPPFHPRILLLKGEESLIRETIASDNVWNSVNNFILSECDKMLSKPPVERVLVGRRLLDKSREALRRIFFLSYAWRMTSDEKYVRRAEKEMLAVSSFTDWNPSHFLDVAEMTMGLAIGYDWLHQELSPETRNSIKVAIVEKGLKPSFLSSNNWWVKSSNNWNQVCNAGMAFGALAVYEDEKDLAIQIFERAVSSIQLPVNEYNPDGAYPEGFGYWGYGTSFHVMLINAMEKAFGSTYDLSAGKNFMKTAGYLENMTGPRGIPFNYSDCGTGAGMNPAMFWFAARLNDPSVLWSEKYFLLNRSVPNDRLLPAVLIWSAGMTLDRISEPSKRIWVGQGKNPVALMRTAWTDPDAIYIGFKAGSPSVNHGHMDVGSFIMDAKGERWAMDFGSQDYNSLETAGVDLWNMSQTSERWDVFRYNNLAHNTLAVNNQYQKVAGSAIINGYSDQSDMLNAISDITPVYNGQLIKSVRGVAIVDNQYVTVRDEILTPATGIIIRWNLLTAATVTITGNNTAELVKNGKKLILKVIEPSTVTMKTWSTVPPHSYDAQNPGTIMVGFEANLPANSEISLSVILLPEGARENTSVSALKLSDWPKTK